MRITDRDALEQLGQLEGQAWVEHQRDEPSGDYSFFLALSRHRDGGRDGGMESEIYGAGGWARYFVRASGDVVLNGSSASPEKIEQARVLGIKATHIPDRKAQQRAEQAANRRYAERTDDMEGLCVALARDVMVFLGNAGEPPSDPQMTTIMASRISGWIAARLGIVHAGIMADVAEIAMSQCRGRESFQTPAHVTNTRFAERRANKP